MKEAVDFTKKITSAVETATRALGGATPPKRDVFLDDAIELITDLGKTADDTEEVGEILRFLSQRRASKSAGALNAQPLGSREWFTEQPMPRNALIEYTDQDAGVSQHYLVAGHPALLLAEGGAGKTHAAASLALAAGIGSHWLGKGSKLHVPINGGVGVLFIAAEEPDEEMHRRFYWLGQSLRLSEEEMRLAGKNIIPVAGMGKNLCLLESVDRNAPPAETPFFAQLLELLNKPHPGGVPWGVVIIDPASRFMPAGAETDAAVATRFIECLEKLCGTPDRPAVVVAHHTNKVSRAAGAGPVGTDAARGSSALTDGVRAVMTLSHGSDGCDVLLSLTKHNYTAGAAPIRLAREEHGILTALAPGEVSMSTEERQAARRRIDAARIGELRTAIRNVMRGRGEPLSQRAIETLLRASEVKASHESVAAALDAGIKDGELVQNAKGYRIAPDDRPA